MVQTYGSHNTQRNLEYSGNLAAKVLPKLGKYRETYILIILYAT